MVPSFVVHYSISTDSCCRFGGL